MKILFYAVNGLGLGHVTRLLAMAREIRKLKPRWEILFITTSESDALYREGFASVKLPSKTVARATGMSVPGHLSILHQAAWSVFASFKPDTTVVDTFPEGFAHELDQVLRWEESKFVYVFRQRREVKLNDRYFQSLLRRYRLILVPHNPGEEGIRITGNDRVVHTGPILIRGRRDLRDADEVKRAYGLPQDKKLILINMGGGGQAGLETILGKIVRAVNGVPGCYPVAALGGLSPDMALSGCGIIRGCYPVCELYKAFTGIIAGCGYNTVHEVLYFRKPGIFIPFERTVDDQERRALWVKEKGAGLTADPGNLDMISGL
ncbi:MAG: UDP-glucosyltransferase, partial [Spirochaetales bacterium]